MQEVLTILKSMYPNPTTALRHDSPFQLLVATILSAQCTDERVNMITQELFPAFPTPQALAAATFEEVAPYVRSAGLWRTKASNLIKTAQILVDKHDGEVPRIREELKPCLAWAARRPMWFWPMPSASQQSQWTPMSFGSLTA